MTKGDGPRLVFDMHQHLGHLFAGDSARDAGADEHDERVATLDRLGITAAAIMPSLQFERPNGFADTQRVNTAVAEYRDLHRVRFPVAMGTVDPLQGVELGVREIRRLAGKLRLDGVVWHHRYQGTYLSDRRMVPFLETLRDLDLPAFVHVFGESNLEAPWALEELVEQVPEVRVVAMDAFSGWTPSRYVLRLVERYPNLWVDTACAYPVGRVIEEYVGRLGSDRILFGTDMYAGSQLHHYPHVLTEIRDAPSLTEGDKDNIFWRNAMRLFRLDSEALTSGGSPPSR